VKKIITAVLFAFVIAGLVFAHSSKAPSATLSDADTLRQLERDWADASRKVDVKWISQLLSDDWRGVGSKGIIMTKEYTLNRLQIRKYKLESTDFGPMAVKVWGNVAVVQGSTIYHWVEDGQHGETKSAWMDVYEKLGDKWVVARSQMTKVQ